MDSGYGYGSLTELQGVSGTLMEVIQNAQKFRVLWHGRTELTVVLCTGMDVVQKSQKFRVRVIPGKIHASGVGFDLKWRILSNLHGMF